MRWFWNTSSSSLRIDFKALRGVAIAIFDGGRDALRLNRFLLVEHRWTHYVKQINSSQLAPVFAKSLISVDIAVDAEAATRGFANCCEGIINERPGWSLHYLTSASEKLLWLVVFPAIPFRTIDISIRVRYYRVSSAMKMLYLGRRWSIPFAFALMCHVMKFFSEFKQRLDALGVHR